MRPVNYRLLPCHIYIRALHSRPAFDTKSTCRFPPAAFARKPSSPLPSQQIAMAPKAPHPRRTVRSAGRFASMFPTTISCRTLRAAVVAALICLSALLAPNAAVFPIRGARAPNRVAGARRAAARAVRLRAQVPHQPLAQYRLGARLRQQARPRLLLPDRPPARRHVVRVALLRHGLHDVRHGGRLRVGPQHLRPLLRLPQ